MSGFLPSLFNLFKTSAEASTHDQLNTDGIKREDYPSQYCDRTGTVQVKTLTTFTTDYQCMVIGSYGNEHSLQVKAGIVPKQKPGGQFLGGVSDDLERVQDMIMNDPRKHLAYVLPDVPGAQRSRSYYISKIENFLKACQNSGALIWYTGHGERMTGNWCFKDGIISFEDIFHLYQENFRGKMLTIVSDCCYAGQWVHRSVEKLDRLKVGACGHKARAAGLILKIFAACQPNETAFDGVYTKECVSIEPTKSLMLFYFKAVEIKQHSRFQTPFGIDTTKITCFSDNKKLCRIDQIPERARWLWKDLTDDRGFRLQLRLFKLWEKKNRRPYWRFMVVYDDKFEEFCEVAKSGQLYDCDMYGYTVFSGYGETPPPEIERLFCEHGPRRVNLPENEPPTYESNVHLK